MDPYLTRNEMARHLRDLADRLEATKTGILIPLYIRPGSAWTHVETVHRSHPEIPVIAIVNPSSGPGTSKSETYAQVIPILAGSGVAVGGYIFTDYAARPLAQVEEDLDRWREWYPDVSAIFIDEMASKKEQVAYYQTVRNLAHAKGFTKTVGNPGTAPDPEIFTAADVIVVSEGTTPPEPTALEALAAKGGRGKMAILIHGASRELVDSWLPRTKTLLSHVYLTEDVLPNPWNTVSSHLERMIEILA